jgi:hypothetical protein
MDRPEVRPSGRVLASARSASAVAGSPSSCPEALGRLPILPWGDDPRVWEVIEPFIRVEPPWGTASGGRVTIKVF